MVKMPLRIMFATAMLLSLIIFGCASGSDIGLTDDALDGDTQSDGDDDASANGDSDAEDDGDNESSTDGDEEAVVDGDDDLQTDGDTDDESEIEVDGDSTDGDAEEESPPPMPVALCGMNSYELLPPGSTGQLVEWMEDPLFRLSAETVDNLLEEGGYTALSPVPYGCRVFPFRYTTQDRGQLVEATALLSIPTGDLPEGPMPTAVFLHGTSGFSDPCAPSRHPAGLAEAAMVAALGFIGIAPDYIGMVGFGDPSPEDVRHAYLVGEQVAIGSWDAVRAAQELVRTELADDITGDDRVVIWGGSQGGHAAMFMEHYAPYYAPEFNVPGVVASVPPLSLFPLVEVGATSFSPPTISLASAIVTMRHWYGAPDSLVGILTNNEPYFLADNADEYVFVEDECVAGEGLTASTVEEIYDAEFISAVNEGRWEDLAPINCYFREGEIISTSVPRLRTTPTLVAFSELDDLVVTAPQRDAYDLLCEQGFEIEYIECMNAGHSEGAIWSLPEQYAWIKSRLAGESMEADRICQRRDPECCLGSPEDKCAR